MTDSNMTLPQKSQQFEHLLLELECAALVAPGIGLGANLGIFDVIISLGKPGTCAEIAQAGGFKERYIQEWLGLMAVGKIVDYNFKENTYSIPEYRIPLLLKEGRHGVSLRMSGVPACTQAAKEVENCFRSDGPTGVPYSSYPQFHAWRESLMEAKGSKRGLMDELIDEQIPYLWKDLEAGISVCEPGCSGGALTRQWAKRFPNSNFLGYDIDKDTVEKASQKAAEDNVQNVSFVRQDGCDLPLSWANKFDLILCILVAHDVPNSQLFLQEMKRTLNHDGVLIMVEARCRSKLEENVSLATARDTYGYSLFHCLPVSLYHANSDGIGLSWGVENIQKALNDAGFEIIHLFECEEKFHARSYFICRNSVVSRQHVAKLT